MPIHISEEAMLDAQQLICLPLVLLINFALFQYLITVYFKRRREIRVQLLFVCAALGFIAVIPLAHKDLEIVGHLNDISETCSMLTFLLQIDVIGNDIARKVKLRSLRALTILAELLIIFGFFVVALNVMRVLAPSVDTTPYEWTDNVMENVTLAFVFVFRFYYLAISRGLRWLWKERKLEVTCYILFATHEYPFVALSNASNGVSWEPVQAVWHRLTLMFCILLTIREKLRSSKVSRDGNATTTGFQSRGPSRKDKESSIYHHQGTVKSAKASAPRPGEFTPEKKRSTTQATTSSRLTAGLSSFRQKTARGAGLRGVKVADKAT
ncbi:hypothetical protein ATCC90586_005608 [Pythium insidiosum]|nr:hypothetical protein ATCC90586_005608 [Pythium insidiosum]